MTIYGTEYRELAPDERFQPGDIWAVRGREDQNGDACTLLFPTPRHYARFYRHYDMASYWFLRPVGKVKLPLNKFHSTPLPLP